MQQQPAETGLGLARLAAAHVVTDEHARSSCCGFSNLVIAHAWKFPQVYGPFLVMQNTIRSPKCDFSEKPHPPKRILFVSLGFCELLRWSLTSRAKQQFTIPRSDKLISGKGKGTPVPCCLLRGAWTDHCFPAPFSGFLHETGLECLKITSPRCFSLKCQRKDSKKVKEQRQFRGVFGRWRTAAIDRTTCHACQRCRKTAVFAVFPRLWGIIWRGTAFGDQQC